jgi:hypothetical protein
MVSYQAKINSPWREFAFSLHQIQEAIEPKLSLRKTIEQWQVIANDLAEKKRKRKPQVVNIQFY